MHPEKVTKLVSSLKDLSYEEKLRRLGLTTLQERKIRRGMVEVFKIFNGIKNFNHRQFFAKKD